MLEQLERLADVAVELARLRGDREALLLETVRTARELTGAAYSSIGLVEGRTIHWLSAAGKPVEEVRGVKQPIDEGLCGWVVRHGRSRRTGQVGDEADYYLQYAEMKSELDVPLLVGETVIGVLNVEDPAPGAFTLQHERLLQLLAGYAALALPDRQETPEL